jgi:hypothetical protein
MVIVPAGPRPSADHRVEFGRREGLRPAHQGRKKPRGGVTGGPELEREFMLCLEPLGELGKPSEVHAVIVALAFVGLAHLRVFERSEFAHDMLERRFL